jgi:two-component system sensor histidine kinase SenX3
MRATRLSTRLLLPAGLILLVVLLGTLQYRWLGQVSEAERAQLQRSLAQRANEFATEFDREVSLAYEQLTIDSSALEGDPWPVVADRYDAWQQRALFPDMVRALYLAQSDGAGHTLARWSPDSRTGSVIEWPGHFDGVKRALANSIPRAATQTNVLAAASTSSIPRGTVFTMALSPVVDTVPALIVPIITRPQAHLPEMNALIALRMAGTDFIVVELDREVLTTQVVPSLVERFFPNEDSNHYRVAIVDRAAESIFVRGLSEADLLDQLHLDATAVFFTGSRFQISARMMAETTALAWQVESNRMRGSPAVPVAGVSSFQATAVVPAQPPGMSVIVQERTQGQAVAAQGGRVVMAGWRLMLQHGAGSLDEAVAQARIRNLTTSFSILGVLIVGMGLIVANARKSEKLAAQQMEFVATVSHELRTPLAVIRSAAQNLSAGVVDDPTQARKYGELIETEGRRLTDMVEEVLEFAGLSGNRRALALRPVDVTWLAHDVVAANAQALAAAGMEAEVTGAADLPLVTADEEALRRALNNLLGNALKYAAEGRWIGIQLSRQQTDGRDEVWIEVADRGPGITPGDLPHLFEPFYRGRDVVERQIHGNGLGLSLVARIAEAHRGSIIATSPPGAGATFTLRLPVE